MIMTDKVSKRRKLKRKFVRRRRRSKRVPIAFQRTLILEWVVLLKQF